MNRRNKRHSKMIIAIAEMMALLALSGCSLSNPFNFPDDNGMIRHGDPINDFAEIHSDDTVGEDNNEGDNNGEGDNGSADGIEAFYTKELESLYSGIKSGTTMEISLGGDPMMMSPEYEFTNAVEGQLNHIFADLDKDGENELVLIRIQKDESVNNFNAIVEIYDKAGNGYELEDTYIVAQIYCGYITSLQFSLLESDDYCYIGIYDYYSYDMFMGQADDKNTVLKYGDGSITVDDEKFKYNSYSGFGTEGMECKSRFRKLGLEKSADCGGYYFALEDGAKNICAVEMKSNDAGTMATVEFIDNSKEEYSRSFEDLCSSGCKVVFNIDDAILLRSIQVAVDVE